MNIKFILNNKEIIKSIREKDRNIDINLNFSMKKLTTKEKFIRYFLAGVGWGGLGLATMATSNYVINIVEQLVIEPSFNRMGLKMIFLFLSIGINFYVFLSIYFKYSRFKNNKFLDNKGEAFKIIFKNNFHISPIDINYKLFEKEFEKFTESEILFIEKNKDVDLLKLDKDKLKEDIINHFKNEKITKEDKRYIYEFLSKNYITIDKEKMDLYYEKNLINKQVFINKNTLIKKI
jgi:hypothetical protein